MKNVEQEVKRSVYVDYSYITNADTIPPISLRQLGTWSWNPQWRAPFPFEEFLEVNLVRNTSGGGWNRILVSPRNVRRNRVNQREYLSEWSRTGFHIPIELVVTQSDIVWQIGDDQTYRCIRRIVSICQYITARTC